MGYGVVFKKTHWVLGFEKVMKIIGGGGLDEKKHWGGGGLHEKKSWGGGSEIVGVPPPPPHVFFNGIAMTALSEAKQWPTF